MEWLVLGRIYHMPIAEGTKPMENKIYPSADEAVAEGAENVWAGTAGCEGKATFLICSDPRICSTPYAFRYTKDEWPKSETVPWQIVPIWIEQVNPSQPVAQEAK